MSNADDSMSRRTAYHRAEFERWSRIVEALDPITKVLATEINTDLIRGDNGKRFLDLMDHVRAIRSVAVERAASEKECFHD